MNLKKVLIIAFILHIILASIIFFILIKSYKEKQEQKIAIENNIVKIVKDAELVNNYENQLNINSQNLAENIFSGFFIDSKTIITASHGTNNENSNYKIFDKFGNEYKGKLMNKDVVNDLAYIKIDHNYEKFSHFGKAKGIKIGEKVYSVNYKIQKREGKINNVEDKKISSNIIFEDGDSGSPLFNNNMELIGINIEIKNNNGISIILE